jgi:pyruvate dehydrogenase E1 component alpha subunit
MTQALTSADVETDALVALYREMCRGRALEEKVLQLVAAREFRGFYHPGRGQEGVQAGVCSALRDTDYLMYAHRGLTYLTAKGMEPVRILGDFHGRVIGSTRGLGAGTVHCVDPEHSVMGQGGTLGSCFPISAGLALAASMRGDDRVAVAFFGEGASARGTFLESGVSAVAWKLPVVWVCENNGWAVSAPIERVQGTSSVAPRAAGIGFRTYTVDGQDVAAVRAVADEAIEVARNGAGPVFIEAMTTRIEGHYTGDMQPYRDRGEVADARHRDPLALTAGQLAARGWAEDRLAAIYAEAVAEMDAADAEARNSPKPGAERVTEGLWA